MVYHGFFGFVATISYVFGLGIFHTKFRVENISIDIHIIVLWNTFVVFVSPVEACDILTSA